MQNISKIWEKLRYTIDGYGTTKNVNDAITLFQKACDLKVSDGCTALGLLYYQGTKIPKNHSKSLQLLTKACNLNNSEACTFLAKIEQSKTGISKQLTSDNTQMQNDQDLQNEISSYKEYILKIESELEMAREFIINVNSEQNTLNINSSTSL